MGVTEKVSQRILNLKTIIRFSGINIKNKCVYAYFLGIAVIIFKEIVIIY